jgi:hypothetical protein
MVALQVKGQGANFFRPTVFAITRALKMFSLRGDRRRGLEGAAAWLAAEETKTTAELMRRREVIEAGATEMIGTDFVMFDGKTLSGDCCEDVCEADLQKVRAVIAKHRQRAAAAVRQGTSTQTSSAPDAKVSGTRTTDAQAAGAAPRPPKQQGEAAEQAAHAGKTASADESDDESEDSKSAAPPLSEQSPILAPVQPLQRASHPQPQLVQV